jgi:hypothetical protein
MPTCAALWSSCMQRAEASDAAGNTSVSAVNYINHILLDERRWACWYRTGKLTLGIASTQRCEGFFGKLKLQLGSISSLQHLGATVHSISACDELESRLLTDALALRTSTQLLPGFDRVSCGTDPLQGRCIGKPVPFALTGLGHSSQRRQELRHALPASACVCRKSSSCAVYRARAEHQ